MIAQVDTELAEATSLERLTLIQRRLDLTAALAQASAESDEDLEATFIKVAAGWGARKGITYQAWRESGVPARVLKQAGITRGA